MEPGCISTQREQHPRAEFNLCVLWHIPLLLFSPCLLFQAPLSLFLPLPDQVSGAEQEALGQAGMLAVRVCRWQGGHLDPGCNEEHRECRGWKPICFEQRKGMVVSALG